MNLHLNSAEITQKEPLFIPKTRFYHITVKSQKIADIFFSKLRDFIVVLADKSRQDLATVVASDTFHVDAHCENLTWVSHGHCMYFGRTFPFMVPVLYLIF
jgi:hypothetical protein